MRVLLIISASIIEIAFFRKWFSCLQFKDMFHSTPSMIIVEIIDAINNSRDMSPVLIHLMHNKLTYFIWVPLQTILQYWDIRFLNSFIGIIGTFGVYVAIWYLITQNVHRQFLSIIVGVIIFFSLVESFFSPTILFSWKLILFGGGFQLLSIYGLWQFLEKKSKIRYGFFVLLMSISLVTFFLLPLVYKFFCVSTLAN